MGLNPCPPSTTQLTLPHASIMSSLPFGSQRSLYLTTKSSLKIRSFKNSHLSTSLTSLHHHTTPEQMGRWKLSTMSSKICCSQWWKTIKLIGMTWFYPPFGIMIHQLKLPLILPLSIVCIGWKQCYHWVWDSSVMHNHGAFSQHLSFGKAYHFFRNIQWG